MKVKDAIKRLRFTIANQNKPNETDVEAFNEILKLFKTQQDQEIQNNILFAKLYAFTLADFLRYYTDVETANKEINRILSEPFELRTEVLKNRLNETEIRNFFFDRKIIDPFLKTKKVDELILLHKNFKDKIPELNGTDIKKIKNRWDFQAVKYNLETSINLSIQKFKSYV